jgi:hypothetical protein
MPTSRAQYVRCEGKTRRPDLSCGTTIRTYVIRQGFHWFDWAPDDRSWERSRYPETLLSAETGGTIVMTMSDRRPTRALRVRGGLAVEAIARIPQKVNRWRAF